MQHAAAASSIIPDDRFTHCQAGHDAVSAQCYDARVSIKLELVILCNLDGGRRQAPDHTSAASKTFGCLRLCCGCSLSGRQAMNWPFLNTEYHHIALNANRKLPLADKHLVTVFKARHELLCCTPFAHVWLASQLAAAWRSALLRFGARLSNYGPDQATTVADFPVYDPSHSCCCCLRSKRHEASPGHGARGLAWRSSAALAQAMLGCKDSTIRSIYLGCNLDHCHDADALRLDSASQLRRRARKQA